MQTVKIVLICVKMDNLRTMRNALVHFGSHLNGKDSLRYLMKSLNSITVGTIMYELIDIVRDAMHYANGSFHRNRARMDFCG